MTDREHSAKPYRREAVLGWTLIFTFAALALAPLYELDLYNQIRSGDDLLRLHVFPHKDSWSLLARGKPWINIEWLYTVLLRLIYGIVGEGNLVFVRALLAAILCWELKQLVDQRQPAGQRAISYAVLLPVSWIALRWRIQLRPELVFLLLFGGLVVLWNGPWSAQCKSRLTPLITVLACQVHLGLTPFLIVVGTFFLVSTYGLRSRRAISYALLNAGIVLLNPYHLKGLSILAAQLSFHGSFAHTLNLEAQPLWELWGRPYPFYRYIHFAYALLILPTSLVYAVSCFQPRLLPSPYHRPLWFWPVHLLFLLIGVWRPRAFPFDLVLVFPLVVWTWHLLVVSRQARALAWAAPVASLSLFTYVVVTQRHLNFGLGPDPLIFPVGSTRFLQATHPKGNLYHPMPFGGYFLWQLREYPVFVDPRESLYLDQEDEIRAISRSAQASRAAVDRYGINIVVIPIPPIRTQAGKYLDTVAARFPRSQWALVYLDRISMVLLRRIPEHQRMIEQNEYRYLNPALPAEIYPHLSPGGSPARLIAQVSQEAERCLRYEPAQTYCQRVRQSTAIGLLSFPFTSHRG